MGETRRHHYVPRCYLKYFSSDGRNINTFIIGEDKLPESISMKGVCVHKDFYTLTETSIEEGIYSNYIEKDYFEKQIEPQLDKTIRLFEGLKIKAIEVTQSIGYELPSLAKTVITKLILIQYFRGPRTRKKVIDELLETYSEEEIKKMDIAKIHAAQTFFNDELMDKLTHKLMSDNWIIRVHPNGDFYTSDNPVVVIDNDKLGRGIWEVKADIGEPNTAIFYPLTNEISVEIYDSTGFPETTKINDTVQFSNDDYTRTLNIYQYLNAERFVFSKEGKFDLFIREI